jgi:hypothetical protein
VKDKKSLHNNTPSNAIVNAVSNVFVLRIKIDNGGRLKTKLYEKRDDFTFPIVNFFISSNILASPTYGVYISQHI